MNLADAALLLFLAAIWGSSFIFMRHLSPILGPLVLTATRMLAAGTLLAAGFALAKVRLDWRRNWPRYLLLGALNTAAPWLLFAWAALHQGGAVSSVVNALTPLWGAVFAALLLGEPIGARKLAGIVLGVAGVALIGFAGAGSAAKGGGLLPVLACVLATVLYGLFGAWTKRFAADLAPRAITAGSLVSGGLILLPFALADSGKASVAPPSAWLLALAFSLLCSALAYLIYYRLIARAGVAFALSVTLLIPVFALLWGLLFLGEGLAPTDLAGAALVLSGTGLIAGKARNRASPR
ncbi:MAG: DMT family transporter [Spirochaetales bacterium]|nr:DMT family transporter [Spirochaetales bacterium]